VVVYLLVVMPFVQDLGLERDPDGKRDRSSDG